jgi:pantothenate kinase-related protein Tda10
VLVAGVSCEIIMVEVWHKEHEKAVLQASKNTDTKQTAQSTEVEVVVDTLLREYTPASLNRPAMQEKLKAQSAKSVETHGAAAVRRAALTLLWWRSSAPVVHQSNGSQGSGKGSGSGMMKTSLDECVGESSRFGERLRERMSKGQGLWSMGRKPQGWRAPKPVRRVTNHQRSNEKDVESGQGNGVMVMALL